MLTLLST